MVEKIIVYTTDTCPHCKIAKAYLNNKGYSFEEKNVDKDVEARNDMIRRGIQGVPAFFIGDELVVGLDTAKIESLIHFKIIKCPACNTKLRVPRGKGNIKVTCPKCKEGFDLST